MRNSGDLGTMACPPKYRAMNTFYKYYSGQLARPHAALPTSPFQTAPVLTIFIGGNHEASNHAWELPYGGWCACIINPVRLYNHGRVAPRIFSLGYVGVVSVGGIRIAGLSGIYNARHYHMGPCITHPTPSSHIPLHHHTSLSIITHHAPSSHITLHHHTSLSIIIHPIDHRPL